MEPTPLSNCPAFDFSSTSSIITAIASDSSGGTESNFLVRVYDPSSGRSDEKSIKVKVELEIVPVVAFTSSLNAVNSDEEIVIRGEISSRVSFYYDWTLTLEGSSDELDLQSMAQTPISTSYAFDAVNHEYSVFPIYLVLKPDKLVPRGSYTFTLKGAASSDSAKASSASISVSVNDRPSPGFFLIGPACDNPYYGSCGIPFETSFTFSASNWVDEHVPISYVFFYIDSSRGTIASLSSRSEKSKYITVLNAGSSSNDYILSCGVKVFDSLDAFSVMYSGVRVKYESGTTVNVTAIDSLLSSSLDSGNVDTMRGTISMMASSLNDANCDGFSAKYCAKTYNREGCRSTSQTCGVCLDGYVGETDDANSNCYSSVEVEAAVANGILMGALSSPDFYVSHMSDSGFITREDSYTYDPNYPHHTNRQLQAQDDLRECNSIQDCQIWEHCSLDRWCTKTIKDCVDDCNGNGHCVFVTSSGMIELPANFTCYINDASCKPVCNCKANYYGESCGYTAETLAELVSTKLNLMQGLQLLMEQEDVSAASIENWINTLLSIASSPDDFSTNTANSALEVVVSIISTAEDYNVKKSDIQSLQSVLDYTSRFVSGKTGVNIANFYPYLDMLVASIIPRVLPGESVKLNTEKLRYSLSSFLSTDTELEVSLDLNTLETYNQDFFMFKVLLNKFQAELNI